MVNIMLHGFHIHKKIIPMTLCSLVALPFSWQRAAWPPALGREGRAVLPVALPFGWQRAAWPPARPWGREGRVVLPGGSALWLAESSMAPGPGKRGNLFTGPESPQGPRCRPPG